jgi:hypothetical protein
MMNYISKRKWWCSGISIGLLQDGFEIVVSYILYCYKIRVVKIVVHFRVSENKPFRSMILLFVGCGSNIVGVTAGQEIGL